MKTIFRTFLASALILGPLVSAPARADDNESACGAVLCLAGLIDGGTADGTCKQYMTGYFAIQRFRHGHFDLSGTANARSDFTNQCQSVGSDQKSAVNSKYGNQQSGP